MYLSRFRAGSTCLVSPESIQDILPTRNRQSVPLYPRNMRVSPFFLLIVMSNGHDCSRSSLDSVFFSSLTSIDFGMQIELGTLNYSDGLFISARSGSTNIFPFSSGLLLTLQRMVDEC